MGLLTVNRSAEYREAESNSKISSIVSEKTNMESTKPLCGADLAFRKHVRRGILAR